MTPETWNTLIESLISLALAVLVPLLGAGINYLLKKANLEKNVAVQNAVRAAIGGVEEFAAKSAKAGVTIDSARKLNMAVERVMTKVPGVDAAEAHRLVEEQLPQVGLGAAATFRGLAAATKQ